MKKKNGILQILRQKMIAATEWDWECTQYRYAQKYILEENLKK